MQDWHCHLLPGLDDGADSHESAAAMAQQLYQAGFTTVYCTPHKISGLYDTTPERVRSAVAELQTQLTERAIPLRLLPGMEYYLDDAFLRNQYELLPLGESRRLLVEIPSQADPGVVRAAVFQVVRSGLTPLIAHPERCRLLDSPPEKSGMLQRVWRRLQSSVPDGKPSLLDELLAMGCLLQGNLGSLAGYYGHQVRRRAMDLLKDGRYSCFGTDAHNATALQSYLKTGLQVCALREE